jgi:tetratricopeptide (TPR) repeat protein
VLQILETPDELTADGYWIVRATDDFDYAVPLLVSNAVEWYYKGAVHENLVPQDDHPWEDLPGLRVIHHADGAREDTRLEHNLELLEQQIAAEPDDSRTIFYLAQTYRGLGEFEEAIELYRRRLTLGGWDEELYYSQWQIGCMIRTMDSREGLIELLIAWNRRPARLEALYDAVVLCREQSLWQLGYTLAAAGLYKTPPNDKLFVSLAVWEWGIKFEYAIAAYWVGDHENAIRVNDELLAMPDLPEHVAEQAAKNRQFSLDALATAGAES